MNTTPAPDQHGLSCELAIRQRRSHKQFDGKPLEKAVVRDLLDLACLAPMHRLSNPWRFAVLDQDAIARLGAWLPQQAQIVNQPDPEKGLRKITKLTEHYFPQLGAMIMVCSQRNDDALVDAEDRDATAAAVQNILLAAEARGLASFWASSTALRHPDTLNWCGFDPSQQHFVASLWLGGRVNAPATPPRRPLEELCSWL